jgi:hypothetical protein
MKAEAVHGAVPLDLEATVTGHPDSTLAMARAVAGEEAGPEGEDSMAENSTVLFFLLFFHLPLVGTCTNCGTVFFLFFPNTE